MYREMEQFTTKSGTTVEVFPQNFIVKEIVKAKVSALDDNGDPFYIVNLGKLTSMYVL